MINSFSLGNIVIHFYSLCILLGVMFAYLVITKEAKRKGISEDLIFNIIFYGLLIGIIGARLYYVIFNFNYYRNDLLEIFRIWNGGLAIHGGIIFGFIFVYFYTKKKNLEFIKLTDIIVPGVILAQSIGRWGNFFNQEAYGSLVSKELLEKLLIPKFIINGMYINNNYYLPTFYIESILCLIGFIIMMIIRKKNLKKGTITAFYLIWYGIIRSIIEIFRTDSLMLGNFKVARIVSVIMIIIGIIIELIESRKPKLDDLYNNLNEDIRF